MLGYNTVGLKDAMKKFKPKSYSAVCKQVFSMEVFENM